MYNDLKICSSSIYNDIRNMECLLHLDKSMGAPYLAGWPQSYAGVGWEIFKIIKNHIHIYTHEKIHIKK